VSGAGALAASVRAVWGFSVCVRAPLALFSGGRD